MPTLLLSNRCPEPSDSMLKLLKKFVCSSSSSSKQQEGPDVPLDDNNSNAVQIHRDIDIRTHYDLKGLIGFPGSFGEVRAAVDLRSGKAVAVKMMKVQKHTASIIKSEIEIMKSLSHENIAGLIAVYENKNRTYIVMDKYDGGDLFDLVVSQGGRFKEECHAAIIVKQILEGLVYLHENRVAHCDIKLCNIMLADNHMVKLIDFGVSQRCSEGALLSSEVGSPSFIAPEVLAGAYSEQCDMWSLGCVVFILLFGFNPFNPKAIPALPNKDKICENILKGFHAEVRNGYGAWFPRTLEISESARDFIAGLLTADWKQRLTAKEALQHPWIVQCNN